VNVKGRSAQPRYEVISKDLTSNLRHVHCSPIRARQGSCSLSRETRGELKINRSAIGQQVVDPERLPPPSTSRLNLRHSETRWLSTQTMKVLCLPCDATDRISGVVRSKCWAIQPTNVADASVTYCEIAVTAQAGVLIGVVQVQLVLSRNTKSSINLRHR
jgi:hypothetical protein